MTKHGPGPFSRNGGREKTSQHLLIARISTHEGHVFRRRNIAPNAGKGGSAGGAADGAGDLLVDLNHPNALFSLIVVIEDPKIIHEA